MNDNINENNGNCVFWIIYNIIIIEEVIWIIENINILKMIKILINVIYLFVAYDIGCIWYMYYIITRDAMYFGW